MVNISSNSTAKENFKVNYIIYSAILLGLVVFSLIAFILVSTKKMESNNDLENLLMFIVPTFTVAMIFISRFMYSKIIQESNIVNDLSTRIGKYRTAKIVSWAMLEGAGLFSIVAYILTASYLFVLVFIVLLGAFILSKPSIEEFSIDFRIEGSDKDELYK